MIKIKKMYLKYKLKFFTNRNRLVWTMYKENEKKYLALIKFRYGKRIWSRHFLIEGIDDRKGYPSNTIDEKRLQELRTSYRL